MQKYRIALDLVNRLSYLIGGPESEVMQAEDMHAGKGSMHAGKEHDQLENAKAKALSMATTRTMINTIVLSMLSNL